MPMGRLKADPYQIEALAAIIPQASALAVVIPFPAVFTDAVDLKRVASREVVVFPADVLFEMANFLRKKFN